MSRSTYNDNKKLTVVNFFSGPGTGKSTSAALLFGEMKKKNFKVELIHESAKEFVWEDWAHIFWVVVSLAGCNGPETD